MSVNETDHYHDIEFPLREFVIIQSQDERFRSHGLRNCFFLSSREDREELLTILEGFLHDEYGESGVASLISLYGACFSAEYFVLGMPSHVHGLQDVIFKRGKYYD